MRGLLLVTVLGAVQASPVPVAAAKFVADVAWRPNSVITADFRCSGRQEQAILGVNAKDIVIAVFLNGTTNRPEVLRYSTAARDAKTATLKTESLDWDPKLQVGIELRGFQRSAVCKGLNRGDGKVDSAHIYWNHETKRFADWVR